jgi:hypothetical protein
MSDDEKRFLDFLDDVKSMPDHDLGGWTEDKDFYYQHMRMVRDEMKDLMLSGACIFQTTMRYLKVVLRRRRKGKYRWIDGLVDLTTRIYQEVELEELHELFEEFLFLLFFCIIEGTSINPDLRDITLRNVFLDNMQYMTHLKGVAKLINIDIMDMKKKVHDYSGSHTTKPHGSAIESHDEKEHASAARLALLNLKALCNNI